MFGECHAHIFLNGYDYRKAVETQKNGPQDALIRSHLKEYQKRGIRFVRDGGDHYGVSRRTAQLAGEYGIDYRTPVFAIYKEGHYGKIVGKSFSNMKEYHRRVLEAAEEGADFIKIMISGLMEFDRFGVLTEDGLPPETIRELIHIAHEEGFAVMAHANGARTVEAAALAGVDSVEHGAYLDTDALHAMRENGTVWVPTLSTIGNLRGMGRFDEAAVSAILESAMENVAAFAAMGGLIAPGTDAGAWAVPHGSLSEYALLEQVLGENAENILSRGAAEIQRKF